MLVDNPVHQQPYSFNTDDFLNLDLFSTTTGPTSYSSRSSSPPSFTALLTPPQPQPAIAFFPQDSAPDSSFFNFNFDDDFTKPIDPLVVPQPASMAPYDFLGAFDALTSSANSGSSSSASSSPSGSARSPASAASPPNMLAIDPQLVGTPSASKAFSDFDEDEEHEEDENEDDDEDSQARMESKRTGTAISAVKVGGHGKLRKGTVQGGGVVKKTGGGGAKDKENSGQGEMLEDGKPADYQKLSSKEKRQLRNKISARNFRVRRKEYITTLEGDIADRDRILDAIRTELGSSQSENKALRQEITALKRALLEGRAADTPVLPPPGPIPPISVTSPAPVTASPTTPATNLLTPNTQKDLPTSPRLGSRGFWGGAGLGGVGITPVHTAIMPEWNVVGGLVKPILGAGAGVGMLQENINPALNVPLADVGNEGADVNSGSATLNGFDGFAEINPFTFKSLDAYRMQLWGKMAAQQHAHQTQAQSQQQQQQQAQRLLTPPSSPTFTQQLPLFLQQHQHQQQQQQYLTGLAANLRPHFFAASTKHNYGSAGGVGGFSTLLSGKASHSSSSNTYPSPPPSPPMPARVLDGKGNPIAPASLSGACGATREQQQHAVYAALASQTLLKRMGSAFWDAFSGGPGPASGPGSGGVGAGRGWDADKVRRVLEGKAVVRVVDVDSAPAAGPGVSAAGAKERSAGRGEPKCITELLEGMSGLGLGGKKCL